MLGDPVNEPSRSNGSPYKNDTGKSHPQRILNNSSIYGKDNHKPE